MERIPAMTAFLFAGAALAAVSCPALAADLRSLCAASARDGDTVICERAVGQFPDDVEARWNFARALYVAGRYERAVDEYTAATQIASQDARSHLELAGALASLKRYSEAVEPIQTAIRLAPDNLMVYRVGAIIYRQMGWPELALDANIKAANLGDHLAVYELSQMYSLGIGVDRDPDEAIKWLTRAAESGHVAAMDQMVQVYLEGELNQPVDHGKAEYWAHQARQAREAFH